MKAAIEIRIAVAFSAATRRYSAAVHVPSAIIAVRRMMVSQDASVSRVIVIGKAQKGCAHGFS
jgi:hypothetical protein